MKESLQKRIDAWLKQDTTLTFWERIALVQEAESLYENLPYPIRYAKTFAHILDRMTVEYSPEDMFAGKVKRIVPTADQRQEAERLYQRWWDMSDEDFQKTAYFCYSFKNNKTDWLAARPPWMLAQGHLSFDWKRLVHEGLGSFAQRAKQRMTGETDQDVLHYLTGIQLCVEAMQRHILRYAGAAAQSGDAERSEMLEKLANGRPETFFEALQLISLVVLISKRVIGYDAACMGRIDQYLWSYYERDMEKGLLTREQALDMLEEFLFHDMEGAALYDHMSEDSEETQRWLDISGEDVPYYLVGGRRADGSSCVNDLSHLFVEAISELNMLKAPVIIVRYFDGIGEDFFRKVCQGMMDGASIYIYNDETMTKAFMYYGVDKEDAFDYGVFSCNNPTIPTKAGSLRQIWFNLAIPLELALNEGVPFSGEQPPERDFAFPLKDRIMGMMESGYWGIKTKPVSEMHSMEDVLEAYREQIGYLTGELRRALEHDGKIEKELNKGRMRLEDCFLDGTIERGCDWITGGVKYHFFMVNGGGIATVTDALYAMDQMVFKEKRMSLEELVAMLKENYQGQELTQRRLKNKLKKFGNDEPEVDGYAKVVTEMFAEEVKRQNSDAYLYRFMAELSTLRDFTTEGQFVGATADGRGAGEPLSENQSPCSGADVSGLSAMLNSVSQIPFDRITGGPMNLRIHPSVVSGKDGIAKLSALFRTYFENGGMQMQISAVDSETLKKAQETPEKYKSLTVRVTGYNAYFTHMGKQAQDELIRRTEHGGF